MLTRAVIRGPAGRGRAIGPHRAVGPFSTVAVLLFSCFSAAAHPSGDEFAEWYRSLKEPGTEGMMDRPTACCSPERDCQTTDYETDGAGRYWITTDGERIQVPPNKILQRTDNPTGRAAACLHYYNGHPLVRCFVRPPEG